MPFLDPSKRRRGRYESVCKPTQGEPAEGYLCEVCGRRYTRRNNFNAHQKLAHSTRTIHACPKCPFKTLFAVNLRRHKALRHLRRRTAFIPRRSISTSKKRKAVEFWEASSATTPEKRKYVEEHYKLTPNSQSRLLAKRESFCAAKKCLFRVEGGGRTTDEFWTRIEEKLIEKFTARRAMGCIVHKRHLINFVFEICAELDINLAAEGQKRGWKSPPKLLRQRIDRFCKKFKIKMKRASRQFHKNPKDIAKSVADMLKTARKLRTQLRISPSHVFNFDEIRIYSSPQDLNSHTLEFASVRDPMAMKVANPKEAYTGIIMANGDGSTLQVILVTTKKLPPASIVHTVTIEERTWENGGVKVTPVKIPFAVIHGITILSVPPGRKSWCSAPITEAMLRLALFKVNECSLLQLDNAPGHINGVIRRMIVGSGRQVLWTPPNASGYCQPCDDLINASFQSGFMKASMDWMSREIIDRHRNGETKNGVPNPSLETMCELVAKAAAAITPKVQRRAFKHTGLTLAPDGSEDDQLSPNLIELLKRYEQDPVPSAEFSSLFFNREEIRNHQPSVGKIFKALCADASKAKEEEFQRIPVLHKMKKDQRFRCGVGCNAQYASKNYVMAKIHTLDCPTRAFLASGWRPSSKSWLAENGFFVRSDAVVEGEECTCSSNSSAPCNTVHVID